MPYDIPLLKEAITTFRIDDGGGGGRGRVEGGFWRNLLAYQHPPEERGDKRRHSKEHLNYTGYGGMYK